MEGGGRGGGGRGGAGRRGGGMRGEGGEEDGGERRRKEGVEEGGEKEGGQITTVLATHKITHLHTNHTHPYSHAESIKSHLSIPTPTHPLTTPLTGIMAWEELISPSWALGLSGLAMLARTDWTRAEICSATALQWLISCVWDASLRLDAPAP